MIISSLEKKFPWARLIGIGLKLAAILFLSSPLQKNSSK